jgi:protein CpxP
MAAIAKNKVLLIIVAVLLLTNIGMLVFLLKMKPPGGRGPRGWEGTGAFLEKKVGFNQDQLKAYQELRSHHWEKMRPLLGGMRGAKENFYRLLYKPDLTDSLLNRYADSIGVKQQAIDLQTFHHFQQVRGLCSPEQRQRFDSLVHEVIYKMSVPYRRGGPRERKGDSPGRAGHVNR